MKPNFALSLSFDGIRLLHRVPGGWHLVGESAFDADDLAGELTMLRRTAQALDPSGLRSKILIPNEQIKYLRLENPRATDDEIRAALDGTTPYAIDELAIDSSHDDKATYIAAVARETLDEALDFARQHRFQPVSFAAVPEHGCFAGEAFFGSADPQAAVERDSEAVTVIGTARPPQPAPFPDAQEPENPADDSPDDDQSKFADADTSTNAATAAEPVDGSEPASEAGREDGDISPIFSSRAKPLRVDLDVPKAVRDAPIVPPREAKGEPVFSSRGRQDPPPLGRPEGQRSGNMPPLPSALQDVSASLDPADDFDDDNGDLDKAGKGGRPELRALLAVGASVAETEGTKTPGRPSPLSKVADPGPEQAGQPAKAGRSGRYLWLILTAILLVFLAAVGIWASVTDTALSRLIFGPEDTVIEVATVAPAFGAVDLASDLASPSMSEEELSDLEDFADLPPDGAPPPEEAPAEGAETETTDTGTAEAVSLPVALAPTILSPAEAERIYAATGVWQRAPRLPLTPRTESADTIFLAAIDPAISGSDAIALPDLLRSGRDAPLEAQALPPPAGTVYRRDAAGFILATPEGTLLPSGVVVTAGAPSFVPPPRPVFETAAEPADETADTPLAAQDTPALANPALAGKRPRARPTALAETIERASLGGRTLDELSGLRPRSRPDGLVVAEAPAAAIAEALAAVAGDPFADATELAVASSERPHARPRNFDRVVAAASAAPRPSATPAIVQGTSGPVPRTVADAATEDNALALRELALIGLSGPANDRRAMIRTALGRVLLVRVGDELDGGRVTSIGDLALTYTKRGRTYTLEMPAG